MESQSSLSADSSSRELSESYIRGSSTAAGSHDTGSSYDVAIAQLAIMGLWMGRNCHGITNNTDALFQLDSKTDSGVLVGQGYSASIARANNTLRVKSFTKRPLYSVRKHVRFWGVEGKQTAMDVVREIRVLTHEPIQRHPNIVSLLDFEWLFWPGEEPSISPVLCLESSEIGDLANFQRANPLHYDAKRKIFLDAAKGLAALHDSGIVHGDIKSENVLIHRDEGVYQAKLCDFGFAVFLADVKEDKARLLGGTYPWNAPEFRRELPCPRHILKLTDVYSLGLLLWRVLLDGDNPFKHVLLDSRDIESVKTGDPPLLYFAQGSILLRPEYGRHLDEIWHLLACTIQKQPWKRKLRTAIRIASNKNQPILAKSAPQLSNNPLLFMHETFNMRNICVPVRSQMMRHLRKSADQISSDPAWKSDFPGENPVINGLIDIAVGDGGLDIDDDPAEALNWISVLAERQYVPMQAIVVRMYDYFNRPMPLQVQQKANEYLANGVVNGSLTALLDYATYWPKLLYQTWDSPKNFFLRSRTFHANGTGFRLDQKAAELQETAAVYEKMRMMGGETPLVRQLYGLDKGNTLLHGCAMLCLPETVQLLLAEFKVDVNACNDNGDTPLLLACRNGKFPIILKLVAKGARADTPNNYGETPLHWVLNIPNEMIVQGGIHGNMLSLAIDMLMYAGGSLGAEAEMWCSAGDYFNRLRWAAGTPLHRAVSRRNIPAAKALILRGADAMAVDGSAERLTPIDIALHQHNEPMLRLLLDSCDFDINTHYVNGHTAYSRALAGVTILEMITIHGKAYPKAVNDTLDLLVSRGFDLTRAQTGGDGGHEYELDALFVAVHYEKLAWVRYFLSSKACMEVLDVNRPNGEHGMTALHQSIHNHRKSIFVALLEAGADPKLRCSTMPLHISSASTLDMKITSLHLVAQQGDPDLFFTSHLLTYDLDIDAPDFYGTTPLACAVIEGNLHIANMLLKHGADVNKRLGTAQSKPEDRRTLLAQILCRDCTLIVNRLKYLVSNPQDVDPALQRYGPPACFDVGESTSALHVFLRIHKGRQDAPFRTCLHILLEAFSLQSRLDYRDDQQQTPLHIAASHRNLIAVSALIGAGATKGLLDGEGQTPEDLVRGADGGDDEMKGRVMRELV
ncbi:hypothetical protein BJX76DRAFT_357750 [Aspergillus varians]